MSFPLIRALALSSLVLCSVGARAQSFSFLGETVRFVIPAGYCQVTKAGGAALEALEEQRRLMSTHVNLMETLAPCAEIARANAGEDVIYSTWMQLQVLAPRGQARKIEVTRSQFVRSLSKSATGLDSGSISKRIDDRLREMKSDLSFDRMKMEVVGADDDALYVMNRSVVRRDGSAPVEIFGMTAMTAASKLPINVVSYQTVAKVSDLTVAKKNMNLLLNSVLKN
jgi:hypothetical protein